MWFIIFNLVFSILFLVETISEYKSNKSKMNLFFIVSYSITTVILLIFLMIKLF